MARTVPPLTPAALPALPPRSWPASAASGCSSLPERSWLPNAALGGCGGHMLEPPEYFVRSAMRACDASRCAELGPAAAAAEPIAPPSPPLTFEAEVMDAAEPGRSPATPSPIGSRMTRSSAAAYCGWTFVAEEGRCVAEEGRCALRAAAFACNAAALRRCTGVAPKERGRSCIPPPPRSGCAAATPRRRAWLWLRHAGWLSGGAPRSAHRPDHRSRQNGLPTRRTRHCGRRSATHDMT